MQKWRKQFLQLLAGLMLLTWAGPLSAIDIEQVTWGFDGRVSPNRFNIVSILVSNPTPQEFDGQLKLQRLLGGRRPVGAVLEKSVFLSPYASRWVQFYPYPMSTWEDWMLSWGDEDDEVFQLPQPRHDSGDPVLLVDPGEVIQRGGGLKRLPENLFPPTLAATDGLTAVVLDHVPQWEAARRQAFLDWLHLGGKVFVLHGASGRFPVFPETLDVLNSTADRRRFGQGLISRNAITREAVDQEFIEQVILGKQPGRAGKNIGDSGSQYQATGEFFGSVVDTGFFNNLRRISRGGRNWIAIYLISLAYIVMVFPGCYMLKRKFNDYRLILGSLLALIVIFSGIFFLVGRRDYGEAATIRSVAIARPLADGYIDVLQWSDAAVARGGDYTIRHASEGRIYSTCQESEKVNGVVDNGVDSEIRVNIPPFSSQVFAHHGKLKHTPFPVSVADVLVAGSDLRRLTLSVGTAFPEDDTTCTVLYGKRFYRMKREGQQLRLTQLAGTVAGIAQYGRQHRFNIYFDPFYDKSTSPAKAFESMFEPLLMRSLNLATFDESKSFSLPPNRLRLFVYTPMTKEFLVTNDQFTNQYGFVLFTQDIQVSVDQ